MLGSGITSSLRGILPPPRLPPFVRETIRDKNGGGDNFNLGANKNIHDYSKFPSPQIQCLPAFGGGKGRGKFRAPEQLGRVSRQ